MRTPLLVLATLLLSPSLARAESWIVFPVFAENPPPRDPTLARMTADLSKVISEKVTGEVRVAEREERDLSCPLQCSPEIASILDVQHVVAMHLAPNSDQLAVIVYEKNRAPVIRKISCTYSDGRVACDAAQLAQVFESKKVDPPLDQKSIEAAFAALAPKLKTCGEQKAGVDASVLFRVRPDGRTMDVRIDPPKIQNRKPYGCMARVVESLRVPPFSSDQPVAFHLPLPK